jgi:hypothetical protein
MQPLIGGLQGLAEALSPVKKKLPKPTHRVIGTITVPHIRGCLVGVPNARGLIRRHGIQKAMELYPRLQTAPVLEVQVKIMQVIDRRKYTGAKLRELRAMYGVGVRPKTKGENHG